MTHPGAIDPASRRWTQTFWRGALVIGALATAAFAYDLAAEPSFVDEWAYVSQTYYADLWLDGHTNRADWLAYPAYDLPPLPKYLFGWSLRAAGYRRPGPADAMKWYRDTRSQCGPPAMLTVARWPTVVVGVLGCLAVYALGTMAYDPRVGWLAALVLMFNPLYRLHARRAMSDVIAESLILLTAMAFLRAWRRLLDGRLGAGSWVMAGAAGVAGGLASLAKLNGALAMIVVVAWALLASVLPGIAISRKLAVVAAATFAGIVSIATFVALNPFRTAQPTGALHPAARGFARMPLGQRMRHLVDHRMGVSRDQMLGFPHNALPNPLDKIGTVCVQGFGRFGPFGPHESRSVIRYDRVQDWGALVWLPLVVLGTIPYLRRGRTQLSAGDAPTAWAVLLQAGVALFVVTCYLPLAWDRYYLSLQPGSALLGAGAIVAAADRVFKRRFRTEGS
jgi:4-amino-4-deoxy-L-arabinose transferase-like glycosyltransferase